MLWANDFQLYKGSRKTFSASLSISPAQWALSSWLLSWGRQFLKALHPIVNSGISNVVIILLLAGKLPRFCLGGEVWDVPQNKSSVRFWWDVYFKENLSFGFFFSPFFAGDRAEGAENKTSDRANKNRSSNRSSSSEGPALDNRMKQLSLQCMKIKEGICSGRKAAQIGWVLFVPCPD